MTLNQIIYNVRNIIKDNRSDDIKISDRQLEFILNYYRARIIKQEVDKNRPLSPNVIQDLGSVAVSKFDKSESITTGNPILRTTNLIPKVLDLSNTQSLTYVGSLDKTSSFDIVSKVRSRYNKYNKYGKSYSTAYYRNRYVYVEDCPKLLTAINVEGVFENPREAANYINRDNPTYDFGNDNYPISEYMIPVINDLILSKEINVFIQSIPDNVNDASTEIKNSNLQK